MKKYKVLLIVSLFLLTFIEVHGYTRPCVHDDSLYNYVQEVEQICKNDNGSLWGKNLFGPILLINTETREVFANQPDCESLLQPCNNLYIGKFPDDKIVSCGVTMFGGKEWAMISIDSSMMIQTIIHESFHRIQKSIGIECEGYHNDHMDDMKARISVLLEWNALMKAIKTNNLERKCAIKDALLIRQDRRALYCNKRDDENRFEIHEGLALYTELKLCSNSRSEFEKKTLARLESISNSKASYMRTFGYYSGLLYACILDEEDAEWRKGLTCNDDLGLKLQNVLNMDLSLDTAGWYDRVRKQYDYEAIYKKESLYETEKLEVIRAERHTFYEEPILKFKIIKAAFGIKFPPHPLDSVGTIYPVIDISDEWGFLSVIDNGCLLMEGNGCVNAENLVIEKSSVTGRGWKLKLNEGWIITKQNDNYTIERKRYQ